MCFYHFFSKHPTSKCKKRKGSSPNHNFFGGRLRYFERVYKTLSSNINQPFCLKSRQLAYQHGIKTTDHPHHACRCDVWWSGCCWNPGIWSGFWWLPLFNPGNSRSRKRIGTIAILRNPGPLLGVGFKYFLFSPLLGEMIPIWLIFFRWVGSTTNQFMLPCFLVQQTNQVTNFQWCLGHFLRKFWGHNALKQNMG